MNLIIILDFYVGHSVYNLKSHTKEKRCVLTTKGGRVFHNIVVRLM